MKGKYLFLFIIRLQMLPFCSYIARGLPFTEEYQSTRCTVWRKIIRTAAFFTTVNDMLLWMTLTVWKNQSRRKAFRCCDSQTTNFQNCNYSGFRHMVFLIQYITMIKIRQLCLQEKAMGWPNTKIWAFFSALLRDIAAWYVAIVQHVMLRYCSMLCWLSTRPVTKLGLNLSEQSTIIKLS